MAICVVSGTVLDPSGTALSEIEVDFNIQTPIISADPVQGSTTTASDGTWSLSLLQGLSGVFTVNVANDNLSKKIPYRFNANIPLSLTASFSSVVVD